MAMPRKHGSAASCQRSHLSLYRNPLLPVRPPETVDFSKSMRGSEACGRVKREELDVVAAVGAVQKSFGLWRMWKGE